MLSSIPLKAKYLRTIFSENRDGRKSIKQTKSIWINFKSLEKGYFGATLIYTINYQNSCLKSGDFC